MNYILGFLIISTILFIYSVDDIHKLFVGAMCATGSLNANPVGWYALVVKIAVSFMAGLWLILNHLDQKAEDYPLIRLKYMLLAVFLPFIFLDSFLQLRYFLGLNPDIITSCCGSLFNVSGGTVASTLTGLPVKATMVVFYSGFSLLFILSILCLLWHNPLLKYFLSTVAVAYLFVAIASIISFVSMYIYEIPTHHCPFDILQKEYNFIGYPLYVSLFCGIFYSLLPGIFKPLERIPSLKMCVQKIERSWIIVSMSCLTLFTFITTYEVIASNLTYFSY